MRSEVQVFPDPPLKRGYSSAGRAPALQAGGQEFEPPYLHQRYLERRGDGLRRVIDKEIEGESLVIKDSK